MGHTLEQLDSSGKLIGATQDQYRIYEEKLDSASKVLGHLKRKTEEDSKYIWYSFISFLFVVAWIVLRRLKVFRMLYWGGSWAMWSGTSVWGLGRSAVTRLGSFYQSFCELLGI